MIKKNEKEEINNQFHLLSNPENLTQEENNPFKRKRAAENQVIEENSIQKFNHFSKEHVTSIQNLNKNTLEFLELEVNDARERVKNISILEFDINRFNSLTNTTGSKKIRCII